MNLLDLGITVGSPHDVFVRNMMTILDDERRALAVYRPAAFASIDLVDAQHKGENVRTRKELRALPPRILGAAALAEFARAARKWRNAELRYAEKPSKKRFKIAGDRLHRLTHLVAQIASDAAIDERARCERKHQRDAADPFNAGRLLRAQKLMSEQADRPPAWTTINPIDAEKTPPLEIAVDALRHCPNCGGPIPRQLFDDDDDNSARCIGCGYLASLAECAPFTYTPDTEAPPLAEPADPIADAQATIDAALEAVADASGGEDSPDMAMKNLTAERRKRAADARDDELRAALARRAFDVAERDESLQEEIDQIEASWKPLLD